MNDDTRSRSADRRNQDVRDQIDRVSSRYEVPKHSTVCKTATKPEGTYPVAAQAGYWVIPQRDEGPETEGAPLALTEDGPGFIAVNIGNAIPPQGSTVLVDRAANRSVFGWYKAPDPAPP